MDRASEGPVYMVNPSAVCGRLACEVAEREVSVGAALAGALRFVGSHGSLLSRVLWIRRGAAPR
jgi:hypothetical protein